MPAAAVIEAVWDLDLVDVTRVLVTRHEVLGPAPLPHARVELRVQFADLAILISPHLLPVVTWTKIFLEDIAKAIYSKTRSKRPIDAKFGL